MAKTPNRGEMPFLDHLEELRWRILWSLAALVVGAVVGYFIVQHFQVLEILKRPISPFLPVDRLYITRPTDAFLITMKLAVLVGTVLASPVLVWQMWRFLAPALHDRERRFVIPAGIAGALLFCLGVFLAYLWVLPAALRILFSFQQADLEPIITANEYFGFAIQIVLAFGLMFELPLVMIMLAAMRIVNPVFFAKNRPYALVIAAIIAAFLTPPDVLSLLLMLGPLLVLYESGIAIGRLVWRARRPPSIGGAAVVLLLCLLPGDARAQDRPPRGRPDSTRARPPGQDSTAVPRGLIDTATARKLGLPTGPSRSFPSADSVMRALLALTGYRVIRYAADSVVLHADTQSVELIGAALVEQEGATLEADSVYYSQATNRLRALGSPTLFQRGTVLLGEDMSYDTEARRGNVERALTTFKQAGVDWYMRGGLSIDSASVRLYAGHSDVTSCDLPVPHYHFAAGSVKWVTNTLMVARPAVLYVRDVPILWLPFIFQDIRPGRRSGILVPRFGINDVVRTNPGFRRHVSNVGYYIAINDYIDFQASLDWFAETSVTFDGETRYRWRDRFVRGGLAVARVFESGRDGGPGGRSLRLRWGHQQSFDQRTKLAASVDYATSARVVERNTVDPFLATATLGSNINFSKQLDWGRLDIGGSRRQDLTNGAVTQTLPTLSLTPVPIDLASSVTWSPSLTVTNARAFAQRSGTVPAVPAPGDTALPLDTILSENRTTDVRFATPLRVGRWNLQNSISIRDFITETRSTERRVDPDNPADTIQRFYGVDFNTGVDWNTGINLPTLFAASWKLQPQLGIQNTTSGPFLLRNRNTNGAWVRQGKRLSLSASLTPTFFGFFPGVGPIARIRHAVTPVLSWNYAPEAEVPEDYARALDPSGRNPNRTSPAQQRITVGLSQTFEGKFGSPPGDTTDGRNARKIKLLSLQTSAVTYDFEQAKDSGRTGWVTPSMTNQFSSDLLPGFSVGTTHDLWDGPAGAEGTRFDPFLSRVSARFTISQATVLGLAGLISARPAPEPSVEAVEDTPDAEALEEDIIPDVRGDPYRNEARPLRSGGRGRPFSASFTYDDQRPRAASGADSTLAAPPTNRTLGVSFAFDPTPKWSVSWTTQYNLSTRQFGQHVVRLERDMHRWRATFQFLKSPNGNFAFNFFITLTDQPDIRFQYDQQTVSQ
ncbi:MAG TPA: twin-arginine translocase subunit TatC [Gemmatimonadales bacterium]